MRPDETLEDLDRASQALRRRLTWPDAALEERVMAAVRRQRRPRQRRLVPAWGLAARRPWMRPLLVPLAAAALLAVWLAGVRHGSRSATLARASADTVFVRFELVAPAARQVSLAGDFNGWRGDVTLTRGTAGVWMATVPLPVGVHHYQFVVDGSWIPDPSAGEVDDGFGGRNSVIVVGPKGVVGT